MSTEIKDAIQILGVSISFSALIYIMILGLYMIVKTIKEEDQQKEKHKNLPD